LLIELSRNDKAAASFKKATDIKPDYQKAWYNQGVTLRRAGQLEAALAALDKAIELQADDYWAWYSRGLTLRELGHYAEAIIAYDTVLQLQPDHAVTYYNKACCYALQNWVDLAIENLQQAIYMQPEQYRPMAEIDPDLAEIRSDVRFQGLMLEKTEQKFHP
jgi:tetratricopeptide (TPR) repeat protein